LFLNPLRKVTELIDFDFAYAEVKSFYGNNGNESVPPPVILKLMLLLVFYNVRSERELLETVPERMDWLWFLGYELDSTIPNHSVLSKARKKWGVGNASFVLGNRPSTADPISSYFFVCMPLLSQLGNQTGH
jgi:transposase